MVFLATNLPPYILRSQNVTNVVLSITKTLNKKKKYREKTVISAKSSPYVSL